MVKLASVIFTLLIKVLIGIILIQLLKATSGDNSYKFSWVCSSWSLKKVILPYKVYEFRNIGSNIKS